MGIDIHALNFLRYVAKKGEFRRVATIGRQSLLVSRSELADALRISRNEADFGLFCEALLEKHFGASSVDSYDYSDYEGATHIVDLGRPIVPSRQYDTVIDCGTAEHIFDVCQVMKNLSSLCAPGGQLIHVLPANNFCGHGFWQFSPQLFFSLYSDASGYGETEVFLADLRDPAKWFKVEPPKNWRRAEVTSTGPLHVMCRTIKLGTSFPENIQQSDYIYRWDHTAYTNQHPSDLIPTLKRMIKARPSIHRLALWSLVFSRRVADPITNPTRLSNRNRHLRKFNVSDLLAG